MVLEKGCITWFFLYFLYFFSHGVLRDWGEVYIKWGVLAQGKRSLGVGSGDDFCGVSRSGSGSEIGKEEFKDLGGLSGNKGGLAFLFLFCFHVNPWRKDDLVAGGELGGSLLRILVVVFLAGEIGEIGGGGWISLHCGIFCWNNTMHYGQDNARILRPSREI